MPFLWYQYHEKITYDIPIITTKGKCIAKKLTLFKIMSKLTNRTFKLCIIKGRGLKKLSTGSPFDLPKGISINVTTEVTKNAKENETSYKTTHVQYNTLFLDKVKLLELCKSTK